MDRFNASSENLEKTPEEVLKASLDQTSVNKSKFSRLAIIAFVLSILSLLLFPLAAIPSIICGAISIYKIKKSDGWLRGKRLATTGIIISTIFISSFILWGFDARPIEHDYTIDDLLSVQPQFNQSYQILEGLSHEGKHAPDDAPIIGLTKSDITVIEKLSDATGNGDYSNIVEIVRLNADAIETAWQNGQKGRAIIKELDTYPEIADLTEPCLDSEEIKFLRNLRYLAYLYQAYVCLRTDQGQAENALNGLIELNSVFRKLSINARSLVTKLVCYAGIGICIDAANFIVNNPGAQNEVIRNLAKDFAPLKEHHTSLHNPAIFEYLSGKRELQKHLCSLRCSPCFKPNSTLRMYKNLWNPWIDRTKSSLRSKSQELNVWPFIYPRWLPALKGDGRLSCLYQCYNIVGSSFVRILEPAGDKIFDLKKKLEIRDHLFQIVLNKKLGKEVEIPSDLEYVIDAESKKIYSLGPDGEPNTCDDVKLIINPEVLNLTE